MFSSSFAAATYIKQVLKPQAPRNKVFVIGEKGVEDELRAAGLPYAGGTDHAVHRLDTSAEEEEGIADGRLLDPNVSVVLCSIDRYVNYRKLAMALAYIKRGAVFLATNSDTTLPAGRTPQAVLPGSMCCWGGLTRALDQVPVSLGKPNASLMDVIEAAVPAIDRARTCMVGDRLNTDIRFVHTAGLGGGLAVLTGVSKETEVLAAEPQEMPDVYVSRLSDLLPALATEAAAEPAESRR